MIASGILVLVLVLLPVCICFVKLVLRSIYDANTAGDISKWFSEDFCQWWCRLQTCILKVQDSHWTLITEYNTTDLNITITIAVSTYNNSNSHEISYLIWIKFSIFNLYLLNCNTNITSKTYLYLLVNCRVSDG
jgi:hypothetical protein